MTLVKFSSKFGGTVYINPDTVSRLYGDEHESRILFVDGKDILVLGTDAATAHALTTGVSRVENPSTQTKQ